LSDFDVFQPGSRDTSRGAASGQRAFDPPHKRELLAIVIAAGDELHADW
jgi:hypothetical protein